MSKLTDKLESLAQKLSVDEQNTLLEYAEFMVSRSSHVEETVSGSPLDIQRPDGESVVAAMQRLSKTYPMLEMEKLLHEASGLMSQHIMQGRAALEVIDELQEVFERYYESHLGDSKTD
ncbi:MAG: Crp/Fnr family transcriptional regulator [Sulfuriflexus sp.]|nr:Crp/Fnr family transcriptional regulator [Sulfuriflexus sp.]